VALQLDVVVLAEEIQPPLELGFGLREIAPPRMMACGTLAPRQQVVAISPSWYFTISSLSMRGYLL
jgi:hypothetical protein